MNIQTITKSLINTGIEENEANIEIKMLLEHFFNYTEIDRIKGKTLSAEDLNKLKELVDKRIRQRVPIQYIIGEAYFMGNYFKVNKDVLIPRDETEILVRAVIEKVKENNYLKILDIGTGSGCIACTIAKNTQAQVLGVDISSEALFVALENVTKLGINNRAIFRKSDLFQKIREEEKFDIIVSNPPYIPLGTKLEKEVLQEPELALFAGENGLEFYRKIIEMAPIYLEKNGWLYFELGIGEAKSVKDMLSEKFKNINVIKDLSNIDRVIYGQLKD